MFDIKTCKIKGCLELQPKVFADNRGKFVKVFHEQAFANLGLETNFVEEYYSVSNKHVIRGLHFQLPPMDLRLNSPTYGQHVSFKLSSSKANSIYIPKGLAHGFCALSENTIMVYNVSTVYSPEHDAGISWDSVGIEWPTQEANLSQRDLSFCTLTEFNSPFKYE